MKKTYNLKQWRRHHDRKDCQKNPSVTFVGLEGNMMVFRVNGVLCKEEICSLVDMSYIEHDELRRKIEVMEWMNEHQKMTDAIADMNTRQRRYDYDNVQD